MYSSNCSDALTCGTKPSPGVTSDQGGAGNPHLWAWGFLQNLSRKVSGISTASLGIVFDRVGLSLDYERALLCELALHCCPRGGSCS